MTRQIRAGAYSRRERHSQGINFSALVARGYGWYGLANGLQVYISGHKAFQDPSGLLNIADEHNRGSRTGLRVAAPERGESWKVNQIPSVKNSAVVAECLAVLELLAHMRIVVANRTSYWNAFLDLANTVDNPKNTGVWKSGRGYW